MTLILLQKQGICPATVGAVGCEDMVTVVGIVMVSTTITVVTLSIAVMVRTKPSVDGN